MRWNDATFALLLAVLVLCGACAQSEGNHYSAIHRDSGIAVSLGDDIDAFVDAFGVPLDVTDMSVGSYSYGIYRFDDLRLNAWSTGQIYQIIIESDSFELGSGLKVGSSMADIYYYYASMSGAQIYADPMRASVLLPFPIDEDSEETQSIAFDFEGKVASMIIIGSTSYD
jgi:hypothetical protein